MDPGAAGKPLIFVSDAADGVIDIYPQSGKSQKMVGQITGLTQPQGITTDKKGDLYVANTNSSNVLVYAPPYTGKPKMTISDAHEFPADVAVSSAGVVAVTTSAMPRSAASTLATLCCMRRAVRRAVPPFPIRRSTSRASCSPNSTVRACFTSTA